MSSNLGKWLVLVTTSFMAGCAPFMVPVYKVDGTHVVDRSLTSIQVKEAIIEGAEIAGWRTKDLGDDKILASFHFKTHTVHVEIHYTNSSYTTRYNSSNEMKLYCSEREMKKSQNMIVSGRKNCPENRPPSYIHHAYKRWMDSLNSAIQSSIASI